jgi:6,7-dimethyl-8-ribityllumazine synthase
MPDAPHIMIVESPYYDEIAAALLEGATAVLDAAGARYDRFQVAGSFEIPAAIRFAVNAMRQHADAVRYDGFIGLGCVIRGETSHYDYVCQESARALQDLAVQEALAIGYGILTVENRDQALARARPDRHDRGGHAARACLGMIELKRHFRLTGE